MALASGTGRDRLGRSVMIPIGLGLVAAGLDVMAIAPIIHVALLGSVLAGSGFFSA